MRALAYFRADPTAPQGHPTSRVGLGKAFDAYCLARGHVSQGVFSDIATSDDWREYERLVRHITSSGLGFLVLVPSAGHLGDSLELQISRVLALDALSCQVVCDDLEMPDPVQGALRSEQGGRGSGSRREAIREGMKAKAARGLGLGKPPFGYRIGVGGVLQPVAVEAEVVRSIFDMYLDEGLGVRSIALALNQRGVKTRRGREWSMVTIRDILRNHSYIGTYHRFGLRIPSSYEAIVGTEDFRLVQERMRNRSPGRRHAKADPFLLSGMLYCRACGQRMLGVTRHQMWRRKDGERVRGSYRYYQCQSRINRNRCEYRTRRAPELEAEVIRLVSWPTDETVYVDEGADGSKAKEQVVARERLKALSGRYRELVQRAGDGMLTLAQLREALEGVEAERSVVNRRLATVDGNMQQVYAQLEQQRVRLENEWEQMSPLEQREVLTSLVSRINLSDNGLEVILRG